MTRLVYSYLTSEFSYLFECWGIYGTDNDRFLKVRIDTIKSWSSGRNGAPEGAIAELRGLYARIETAAGEALTTINHAPPGAKIELGMAADDYEAQHLGWPCVGAHAAVLGLVAARTERLVRIVPRGTNIATAAAEIC